MTRCFKTPWKPLRNWYFAKRKIHTIWLEISITMRPVSVRLSNIYDGEQYETGSCGFPSTIGGGPLVGPLQQSGGRLASVYVVERKDQSKLLTDAEQPPHARTCFCTTAQSIFVSSNRFTRSRSERSVTDTATIVYSDARGLFFLNKAFFNLASRKCSQCAAGSRTKSCSISFGIIAL
jgi:hypothetical protein